MEVEILSTQIINPAPSSIPLHHPNTFPISLLDKLSPQVYTPIIFFYSFKHVDVDVDADAKDHFFKEIVVFLKLSLSETLGRFYVLAGKINDNIIHCFNHDEGALFLQAAVNIAMDEFLKQPNLGILGQLIPFPYVASNPAVQIAVQVNKFAGDGGIAIGVSLLHSVIDGATMSSFIKSWAASCRGVTTAEKPVCGDYGWVSSFFPHREIPDRYALFSRESPGLLSPGERSCTRRFVFDAMAISKLKAQAKSDSVSNPTCVEVVTCLIWKCAMKVVPRKPAGHKSSDNMNLLELSKEQSFVHRRNGSVLIHFVNMRRRIDPPLSEASIGNIIWRACSYYEPSNTDDTKLEDLEHTLRQSLSKIDNDFVRKMIGDDGFEIVMNLLTQLHENYNKGWETYFFTSWLNMGLKEVDFGWGKPIWIGSGGNRLDCGVKNFVILMETVRGNGIEAWIMLEDEKMKLLESDSEFLQFASPNPSIILASNRGD